MLEKRNPTLAVLFSGGDSPGMNAFLRALVRLGLNAFGATLYGIRDGFAGLGRISRETEYGTLTYPELQSQLEQDRPLEAHLRGTLDIVPLRHQSVSGLAGRPGIVLGAARYPQFANPELRADVARFLQKLDVSQLVVCGGNGSLRAAEILAGETGIQVIGVPGTIDNDVDCTETSLGFDSAVNTLVWTVDRFAHTADSHHRVMVLQVMGRDSGELARTAALATGAEIVVTPERGRLTADRFRGIADRLENLLRRGKRHAIVLVAQGVKIDPPSDHEPATVFAQMLQNHFENAEALSRHVEVRESILGHLQRGGSPSAADRVLAAQFADAVWNAVRRRSGSGTVGLRRGRVVFQPFGAAANRDRRDREHLYEIAKGISKWK